MCSSHLVSTCQSDNNNDDDDDSNDINDSNDSNSRGEGMRRRRLQEEDQERTTLGVLTVQTPLGLMTPGRREGEGVARSRRSWHCTTADCAGSRTLQQGLLQHGSSSGNTNKTKLN